MFKILSKQIMAQDIKRMDILAPNIAGRSQPGQFVSITPVEGDERIPLTIINADRKHGSITIIFQECGYTTRKLGQLPINEYIYSILGPLGKPATIDHFGTVVCIATGVGVAQILPICRSLKGAGNKVIGIIGAKTKKSLMLEPQFRILCNKAFMTTNDGSYEQRGLATDVLRVLLSHQRINHVYAIGTVDMLESVCVLTKKGVGVVKPSGISISW